MIGIDEGSGEWYDGELLGLCVFVFRMTGIDGGSGEWCDGELLGLSVCVFRMTGIDGVVVSEVTVNC